MKNEYYTAAGTGSCEIVEKKSRFLGLAVPLETEEAAQGVLDRVRKEHYKARHHCYAFVLGEGGALRRSSDDGEPQGTAGAPILQVIDRKGCTNVLIVVTRYFGGTLLGTGGLVRAYTQAAAGALSDAGIVLRCRCSVLEASLPYAYYDRLQHYLQEHPRILCGTPAFGAEITLRMTVRSEDKDTLTKDLSSLTGRNIRFTEVEEGFFELPSGMPETG